MTEAERKRVERNPLRERGARQFLVMLEGKALSEMEWRLAKGKVVPLAAAWLAGTCYAPCPQAAYFR
ncbi:MAG: hypothetical protein AB7D07_07245 [Desulfovibrionaceae bacterium]